MTARPWLAVPFVVGALFGSCSDAEVSSGPQRSEPSDSATGPVVASLDVGATRFWLHDEGDGCLALEVSHPGLQSTVDRHCFSGGDQVLAFSSECGWLIDATGTQHGGCDVPLPIVMYGQVLEPAIGFVCIGTSLGPGAEGVASARLVPFDERGYILQRAHAGESPHPHLFTQGGLRYGEPPLDAPSDPIYRMCEEQAPWGTPERELHVLLFVDLDESLRRHDVTLLLDGGTGRIGLNGSSVEEGDLVTLSMRVPQTSAGVAITIELTDRAPLYFIRPWPDEFQAILDAGAGCEGHVELRLAVTDGTATGSDIGMDLNFDASRCGG
jgi:hypothetical protein